MVMPDVEESVHKVLSKRLTVAATTVTSVTWLLWKKRT
jgi:hypothetical protein